MGADRLLLLAVQDLLHHRLEAWLHHRSGGDLGTHQKSTRFSHRGSQDYYDELLVKYTHKRELFLRGLDSLGLSHNTPEGAYYVLLDISRYGYDSDLAFCEMLARDIGVGTVPGSSFFREPVNHLIRLHFAKKDETLLDALNRLEGLKKL